MVNKKYNYEKVEIINKIRDLYISLPHFYRNQSVVNSWETFKDIFYAKRKGEITLDKLKQLLEIARCLYEKN